MSLRVRRSLFVVLAAFLVTVACPKDDPFVPVVTTITVSPTTRAFTALTDSQQFTAAVLDQQGNAMSGAVVWGTNNGSVATVSTLGVVTAQSVGSATISARIGTVSGSAAVTVTQVPTSLLIDDGNAQSAPVGNQLPVPVVVRVTDARSIQVPGVTVSFNVTAGGGTRGTPSAATDGFGRASTTWTMGSTTGPQSLTASSTGLTSVVFNATALAAPPDTVIKQTVDPANVPAGGPVTPAPAVLVRDRFDNPAVGVAVSFVVTQGGGLVTGGSQFTNASGIATVGSWVVGASGAQQLTATVTGAGIGGNPVTFATTALPPGAPTSIVVAEGDGQTGLLGYPVNVPPGARVRDASNNPVQGATVTFAVTGGGGSVTGATATTDLQGIARVGSWTINLGANTLEASVAGVATPATFNATGVGTTFNIEVRYLVATTPSRRAAFDSAAARWSRVIFMDVPNFPVNVNSSPCSSLIPPINETIDDVIIFAVLDSIDGPNQILGQAGPCAERPGAGAILYGLMRFDTADVANMEADGQFVPVILHEMAHVLGLGSRWQARGLLTGAGTGDPFFTGAQARAAFDAIGGTGYVGGGKVPVENTGGPGTANAHWRESVFDNELMTGFINFGVFNPLSRVTSAQFADLGYQVNLGASDAFTLSFPLMSARSSGRTIHLVNDVLRKPILVIDATGRVVQVLQPQ